MRSWSKIRFVMKFYSGAKPRLQLPLGRHIVSTWHSHRWTAFHTLHLHIRTHDITTKTPYMKLAEVTKPQAERLHALRAGVVWLTVVVKA